MPDLDYRQPICVGHDPATNMTPLRNGVIVRLSSDRLIVVDLWECPQCEARMIDRMGMGKMVERFEGAVFDHLDTRLAKLGPDVQVGYPERDERYAYAEGALHG